MEKEKVLNRLNAKTIKDPISNCWLYQGYTCPNGYGQVNFSENGQRFRESVHRLSAWIYKNYDLESDLQVNHEPYVCLNRNCWNPDHVYIGNQRQNNLDSMQRGTHISAQRKEATHCKRGHSYSEYVYYDKKGGRRCTLCQKLKRNNEI